MTKNSKSAPEAPEAPEAEAPVAATGQRIETRFEIVDNTAAEKAPEREADSVEKDLGNGMKLVSYF